MSNILNILRLFKLTALRANGTGVAGATVRILNAAGVDVTAGFFTTIEPVTDTSGLLLRPFVTVTGLPAGSYTIQVLAAGFAPWSFTTAFNFTGHGTFTANLTLPATAGDYLVSQPSTLPASSMAPIVTTVHSPNAFEWEYVRCRVEGSVGKSSVIEAPVEKATGEAVIDFRNRVQLGTRPLLVGTAPLTARPDTDFSDVVSVSFRSLSPEGETPLTFSDGGADSLDEFHLPVAATLPPDGQADLSGYVTPTNREWVVPYQPVMAFRGYYQDVSVWLPIAPATAYLLTAEYFDGAGQTVATDTANLSQSAYVQRIRLNTDPEPSAVRCVLTITDGLISITKPLTILYRD